MSPQPRLSEAAMSHAKITQVADRLPFRKLQNRKAVRFEIPFDDLELSPTMREEATAMFGNEPRNVVALLLRRSGRPFASEQSPGCAPLVPVAGSGGRPRSMTAEKVSAAEWRLKDSTPPKDVAAAVGVSLPTLYRWVPAGRRASDIGTDAVLARRVSESFDEVRLYAKKQLPEV
jgi:hypothetical protein